MRGCCNAFSAEDACVKCRLGLLTHCFCAVSYHLICICSCARNTCVCSICKCSGWAHKAGKACSTPWLLLSCPSADRRKEEVPVCTCCTCRQQNGHRESWSFFNLRTGGHLAQLWFICDRCAPAEALLTCAHRSTLWFWPLACKHPVVVVLTKASRPACQMAGSRRLPIACGLGVYVCTKMHQTQRASSSHTSTKESNLTRVSFGNAAWRCTRRRYGRPPSAWRSTRTPTR